MTVRRQPPIERVTDGHLRRHLSQRNVDRLTWLLGAALVYEWLHSGVTLRRLLLGRALRAVAYSLALVVFVTVLVVLSTRA